MSDNTCIMSIILVLDLCRIIRCGIIQVQIRAPCRSNKMVDLLLYNDGFRLCVAITYPIVSVHTYLTNSPTRDSQSTVLTVADGIIISFESGRSGESMGTHCDIIM